MSTSSEGLTCLICSKRNAKSCGRCKSASYCSKDCQKADWPIHKLLCADYSRFDFTSRPNDKHYLAILFPVDANKPKLIWLNFLSEEKPQIDLPDVKPFLGPGCSQFQTFVEYSVPLRKANSDTIELWYRDNFQVDGSESNKFVQALPRPKDRKTFDWRGPFVASVIKGRDKNSNDCKDITLHDFRFVTDHFITYRFSKIPQPLQSHLVQAVRVNSRLDREGYERSTFEIIRLASDHNTFGEKNIPDVSALVDIPLFTSKLHYYHKIFTSPGELFTVYGQGLFIDDMMHLHLCYEPNDVADPLEIGAHWGFASWAWSGYGGPYIAVRQDMKPLFPLHMEALVKYSQDVLEGLFNRSLGKLRTGRPLTRDAVLRMINPTDFAKFWDRFMQDKRNLGEDPNVPSPYDV